MASVAYWYARTPTAVLPPPPVEQRMPVPKDNQGKWLRDSVPQTPGRTLRLTDEMIKTRDEQGRRS
jgi:hypothetical protein